MINLTTFQNRIDDNQRDIADAGRRALLTADAPRSQGRSVGLRRLVVRGLVLSSRRRAAAIVNSI